MRRQLNRLNTIRAAVAWVVILAAAGRGAENYTSWSYETTLNLTTTSAGANVTDTVTGFPVLIRLEPGAGKFQGFGAAKADGGDIRFANSRGDHLPYEIERWVKDTIAEIWVLVDTIYGNSTTSIKMYYGNPMATDSSRPDLVFDTANGFVGVYHLSDNPADGTPIQDATGYGNHGTVVGTMPATSMIPGQVGRGLDFEHDSAHYIHLANEHHFDMTTALTISAWVRVESWPGNYAALVAKRDNSYRFHQSSKNPRISLRCNGPSTNSSPTVDMTPGVMYHLVGRYEDSVGISIWHDGMMVGESFSYGPVNTNNYNVTIGNNTVEDSVRVWDGLIDEVRISKVARSDGWIKLCHENQKAPQSLVSFGPTVLLGAYVVSVGVDSTGWGTTAPPTRFRSDTGDTTTITATPADGYRFVRWEVVSGSVQILSATTPTTGVVLTGEADAAIKAVFGCTPPTITAQPESLTVVGTGQAVTLGLAATVCPSRTPAYQWFRNDTAIADNQTAWNDTLVIAQAQKADSGFYYCRVRDQSGAPPITSDTVTVTVLASPTITQQPQDRAVVKNGTTNFSVTVTGDGAMSYQWYENGVPIPASTGATLSVGPVTLAMDSYTYYCVISNQVGSATSRTASLTVTELPNPFRLSLWRPDIHDVGHVSVKIWSEQDLSTFPYTPTPLPPTPYADTLILAYRTGSAPDSIDKPGVRKHTFLIADIAAAPDDTLLRQIAVPPLSAEVDSFYHFSYTIRWHHPDTTLPLITWGPVFMLDTASPPNDLVVWGSYDASAATGRTDTAIVHIDSLQKLDSLVDSIRIRCGWANDITAPMILDTMLAAGPLRDKGRTAFPLVNADFPGEQDTVYCWWYVVGTNGVAGTQADALFTVGWPRPVYTGILRADSIGQADKLILRWDHPGQVDSVRIWVDKSAPIPGEHAISLPPEQAYRYGPGVTTDTVTGLSGNTRYHFGLQVYRDGLWSVVTDGARDSATTSDWCGDTVGNVVRVDTAWFDAQSNELVVGWVLTAQPVSGTFYEMGYSYGLDSATVVIDTPVTFPPVDGMQGMIRIGIRKGTAPIVADTTYHVGFWLRGNKAVEQCAGPPAPPKGEALGTVRVPPLTWEPVDYFTSTDTVRAFDGRVMLVKPSGYTAAVTSDTLETRQAVTREGLLPAGTSFAFRKGEPTMPFLVGIRYDSLPGGVTSDGLKLYRDSAGVILVEHGSYRDGDYVWVETNDLKRPFLIFADTIAPRVEFLRPDSLNSSINADLAQFYEYTIIDNVANARWRFSCAPGNKWYGDAPWMTAGGYRHTADKLIPSDSVSSDGGLRIKVEVDDGTHEVTVNVSRQVRVGNLEEYVTPQKIWAPLRVRGTLDDPSFETVCTPLAGEEQFKYDNTKFRAFRWMPATGDSTPYGQWLEYSAERSEDFKFLPGHVIWVKTKTRTPLLFGSGETNSLREPVEIELAPANWTDIATPYKFEVMLKDVFSFTNVTAAGIQADSLEVIRWRRDDVNNEYAVEELYTPILPRLAANLDTASLRSENLHDAYSIYNPYDIPVTLRIPPIPDEGSALADARLKARAGRSPSGEWSVTMRSRLNDVYRLNEVICGLSRRVNKRRYLPLRPSMRRAGVAVKETPGTRLRGHAVVPALSDGGTHFTLVYYNDETEPVTITSRLERDDELAQGLEAAVFVPAKDAFEPDVSSITVRLEPGGRAERHLLVGTSAYLHRHQARFVPPALGLLGAWPNPSRGLLTIRYSLPHAHLEQLRFALYDVRGRRVWHRELHEGLRPGEATLVWDGRNRVGSLLAAGLYVLRMEATEAGTGRLRTFETLVSRVR